MCFEQAIGIHALLEQRVCPYKSLEVDAGINRPFGSFRTQMTNCV